MKTSSLNSKTRDLSVNSAIITINHEGMIQSVDKGACQMFGYELEELMGQKVNILLPTPYREQHDTYLHTYHQTNNKKIIGKSRLVEGMHKDGTIFPIRLAVSEVSVGDRNMYIGMIDKVEDSAGTITANRDGIIISCNKQCESIFGYTVGELVGQNLKVLMPSPHQERHDDYLKQYHETGKMRVIGHTRNVPAQHKNGTVFPICLQVTKITVGVVELFKGRVEKVFNDCEAVFTLSEQGIIVSCNKHFVTPLFGYADTELIGNHINVLIPSLTTSTSKSRVEASLLNQTSNDENNLKLNSNELRSPTNLLTYSKNKKIRTKISKSSNNNNNNKEKKKKEEEEEEDDDNDENQKEDHQEKENKKYFNENISEESSISSDFSISGQRRLQVRHKDGSVFPVDFSINKFHNDDVVLYSGRIRRVDEEEEEEEKEKEKSTLGEQLSSNDSNSLIGDYLISGNIGQGSYGTVKVGQHKITGQKVAIKILQKDLMDNSELIRSRREIQIQRQLDHPHIAKLYEVVETEDRLHIVMEYGEGGELLTYITERNKLNDVEARRLFMQILSAVIYCHKRNIIHRDIKHKNILLDGNHNIKLIDFGLSNFIQLNSLRSTFCGTPAYAAPEMILAKKYVGPEVDVWSMGVVLYSMVCGRFPFSNVSHIIEGQYNLPPHISPGTFIIRSY